MKVVAILGLILIDTLITACFFYAIYSICKDGVEFYEIVVIVVLTLEWASAVSESVRAVCNHFFGEDENG